MAESLQYKTILACFDKLVDSLKLDPLTISNELVAKSLIPPADEQIDGQKLAEILLKRVKVEPSRYYDIIYILSRHDWLKDIVEILRKEHCKTLYYYSQ